MNPHATNQPEADPDHDRDEAAEADAAFDQLVQKLDTLIQSADPSQRRPPPAPSTTRADTAPTPDATTPPDAPAVVDDDEAIAQINAMLEVIEPLVEQDPDDTEPDAARALAAEDDGLPDLSPDATDLPITPAPAAPQAPPAPPAPPAPAAQAPAPAAQAKPAAASPAEPPTAVGTQGDDPSTMDLDAEIEALLAEQAIDPEVLSAAEDIAQQDAANAEQNKQALQMRAQEAAGLLESIDDNTQPVEDDITAEIDALLSAVDEPGDDALTASGNAAQATDAAIIGPTGADPTIDQIDQLLAAEAQGEHDEDELAGAFFSTQAIASGDTTAGEQPQPAGSPGTAAATDAGEATPEVYPLDTADTHPARAPGSDPAIDMDPPIPLWRRIDWPRLMDLAEEVARRLCWLVNWPARRFLTAEWRATLGYLALVQVAGAAAVWLFLVIL